MTDKQKDIFISIASIGWACGLEHPFEWFVHYLRTMDMWARYKEIPKLEKEAYEAYLAFFKKCKCHPDDPIDTWTHEDLNNAINNFYKKVREKNDIQP